MQHLILVEFMISGDTQLHFGKFGETVLEALVKHAPGIYYISCPRHQLQLQYNLIV